MTTNSRTNRQPVEPHEASEWSDWLDDNETRETPTEDLHDGGLHLLDLVAAVDYLTRGHRSGLTVWDALEEALRWWTTEHALHHHGASNPDGASGDLSGDDPMKDALQGFVAALDEPNSTNPTRRPPLTRSNKPSAAGPPQWPNTTTPATTGPIPPLAAPSHPRCSPSIPR